MALGTTGVNGVESSDRDSQSRSGTCGGKKKRSALARTLRNATVALVMAAALVVTFGSATFADYADGGRTEQATTLPDAVKVWRQEAWQRDDFLAQVRLGDLYSTSQSIAPGESKNPSFADPVEAYVWYFMALRPYRDYRADDNSNAANTIYNVRNYALNNAEQIYNSLTFEQRLDARARILYILSSRGAEGFLTLGRIHVGNTFAFLPPPPPYRHHKVRLCMRSDWDHWYDRWLWWLWANLSARPHPHPPVWKWVRNVPENLSERLPDYLCYSAEIPPPPSDLYSSTDAGNYSDSGKQPALVAAAPQASVTVTSSTSSEAVSTVNVGGASSGSSGPAYADSAQGPANGYSGYDNDSYDNGGGSYGGDNNYSGGGYYGGRTVSSVFVADDAEALTYFLIAQSLGHPLAAAYVGNERGAIRYNNNSDSGRVIADAEKRARFWSAPYEYYPGATSTGDLHSDESLPSFEQRVALARAREIPLPAIVEALDFRGYRMNPRLCGPPPVCLHNAVSQFQTALKWDPTGWLFPIQMVRLIQMAAVDGDAIAQDRLGIMYAKGIGVPQNFVKAEKWFIKSANQRYPDALFNLSVLYRVGPNGIDPDEHKSNSYRQQAERAGYVLARCELLDLLRMADAAGRDRPEGARR